MASKKKLKLTLKRSVIGALPKHKECIKGLGLRRLNQTVTVADNPCNRGMVNKVTYLLQVEEVS